MSKVCDRWIYRSCLCFALDFEEQKRSRFRYHFFNYQMEYSRNLTFTVGGRMEQVLQTLIDRSRAPQCGLGVQCGEILVFATSWRTP